MQNEIFKASSGCHCKRKHQVLPVAADSQMWLALSGGFADVVLLHLQVSEEFHLLDSLVFQFLIS